MAGYIFDRIGSFLSNFFVAGVILLPGILAYLLLLGKIEQMPSPLVEITVEQIPTASR